MSIDFIPTRFSKSVSMGYIKKYLQDITKIGVPKNNFKLFRNGDTVIVRFDFSTLTEYQSYYYYYYLNTIQYAS